MNTESRNTQAMKIDIWSDFLCPYCLLGKQRLLNALEKTGIKAEIEIKSFLLDPEHDEGGQVMAEHLKEKYGMQDEDVKEIFDTLTALGEMLGFALRFDLAKSASTNKAHALFQFAKTLGLGTQLNDRLQRAAFMEGALLSDEATLLALAKELGIPEDQARAAMTDQQQLRKALLENQVAAGYGARGVPFFVLNHRLALSGAQGEGVFINALKQAAAEAEEQGQA